jgi:hypothetical protein
MLCCVRFILAILAMASSVHAAVEVITAENFAEKSHAPVAWLLHLDGGADSPAGELRQLVANCGKYFGQLFPQGDVRVGHIDLESEPQLRQAFCGSGAAACPPLVLLPLWSGGRGRLQTQRSKVYTGQPSLVELVQFVKTERMPSGGPSATMTQAGQAQSAQAQAARTKAAPSQGASSAAPSSAELQAWLQSKPALLEAVHAGKLSASQLQQVKQMAQQEIAQQRSEQSGQQQRAAPVDPRDAGSTPAPDARGGGGGGGGGGRQSERPGAAGGKGGSVAGRAVAEEGGDPFDFSATRLDASAGKGKRAPKRRKSLSTGRRGAAAKKRQWWCMWLCRK